MTPIEIANNIKNSASLYVDRLWPSDFTGACATASKALTLALNAFGHTAHHAVGKAHFGAPETRVAFFNEDEYISLANAGTLFVNHCWTILDREIWDLTAEQFDVTTTNILVLPDQYESDYHPYIIDPTYKAFRAWPREQQPTIPRIRKLLKWMPDTIFFHVMKELATFKG